MEALVESEMQQTMSDGTPGEEDYSQVRILVSEDSDRIPEHQSRTMKMIIKI